MTQERVEPRPWARVRICRECDGRLVWLEAGGYACERCFRVIECLEDGEITLACGTVVVVRVVQTVAPGHEDR